MPDPLFEQAHPLTHKTTYENETIKPNIAPTEEITHRQSVPYGNQMGELFTYTVNMKRTRQNYVYTIEHPVYWEANQLIPHHDNTFRSTSPIEADRSIGPIISAIKPYKVNLSDEQKDIYLALPPNTNPKTRILVEGWKKRGLSERELIYRSSEFLQQFTYSLKSPPLGRNQVDDFIFETKIGYCQHFSSSFAVMMRMAGIPSRIVMGYTGGELNTIGNYWRLSQSNAHAWNEVYLDGEWIKVDPTPADGLLQEPSWMENLGLSNWLDWLDYKKETLDTDLNIKEKTNFLKIEALADLPLWVIFVLMAIVFTMLAWMIYRVWRRPTSLSKSKLRRHFYRLVGYHSRYLTFRQHVSSTPSLKFISQVDPWIQELYSVSEKLDELVYGQEKYDAAVEQLLKIRIIALEKKDPRKNK